MQQPLEPLYPSGPDVAEKRSGDPFRCGQLVEKGRAGRGDFDLGLEPSVAPADAPVPFEALRVECRPARFIRCGEEFGQAAGSRLCIGQHEARAAVVVGDSVQITLTERTLEYRDSTYYARVVGPAVGTLGPRLDYFETYNKTVERVQLVREPYAWELGPAMGAWMTTDGSGVWAGAYVRRTFGRFSVSASAGYDPRKKSAFGQVEARMALWRR